MKTCYYAHAMSLYGTPQERRDILTLESLGFEVVNPNTPEIEAQCLALRAVPNASTRIMLEVFSPLVKSCGALAFRAMPDGSITAGVAREIDYAALGGIPIIELPAMIERRRLSISQTRDMLAELGQR